MELLSWTGWACRCTGTAALLSSCLFNFTMTPYFECLLDGRCTDPGQISVLSGLYARSLCFACFVSFAVVWLKWPAAMAAYDRRFELHDAYAPTTAAEHRTRGQLDAVVVVTCLAVIVPVNATRVYMLFSSDNRSNTIIGFFTVMYVQNISVCMLETRFVALCRGAHDRFVKINRHLEDIEFDITVNPPNGWLVGDDGSHYRCTSGQSLVGAVEALKIRHRLVREALDELNDLFATPMGLSLCLLCIMTMFDVYYYVSAVPSVKSTVFIFVWLLQYGLRFFMVVKMAQVTTDQVNSGVRWGGGGRNLPWPNVLKNSS